MQMSYLSWFKRRSSWKGLWKIISLHSSKTAGSAYLRMTRKRTAVPDDLVDLCAAIRPELFGLITQQTQEQIRLATASWDSEISGEAKKLLVALFEPLWHPKALGKV